jgi:uncharacterized protein YydD (DUF2326 family)
MRLVHIESNFPEIFAPISFHDGLNVIFAQVQDPTAKERSSHNLGKSFLMQVIDFALGSKIDKDHPFKRRPDLFGDFEFTLQVRINDGRFISARRPVTGRAKCAVFVANQPTPVGGYPDSEGWSYPGLSIENLVRVLNELLTLEDIQPFSYRKGLTYQLRGQGDYVDEFRTSNFAKGRDRDWRPFVAHILGFEQDVLVRGYDIEDRITNLKKVIKELEQSDTRSKIQYDEVRGLIEIREQEIAARREELGRFQFTGVEREVNRELVAEVEAELGGLNNRRYSIDRDLRDIDRSLEAEFDFDLDLVKKVYHEAGVIFPTQLVHDFEAVVAFNRQISSDRTTRLRTLREELVAERAKLETKIDQLDGKRQVALHTLREAESFEKYRQLTDYVFTLETNLRELRERLAYLSEAAILRAEMVEQQKQLLDAGTAVEAEIQSSNEFFSTVRKYFNRAVHEILGVRAVLAVGLNNAQHVEFKTSILDEVVRGRETHEGEGTSYKKLLCACVDLALLQAHARGDYYRFVYHDGIFEGLDNRRKVALLEYVRRITAEHDLQYILTVIDSDMPRDERDRKLMFTEDEVILRLHDSGDDGRLFRMARF